MGSQLVFIVALCVTLFFEGYFDSKDSRVLLLDNGKRHNAVIVSTNGGSSKLDSVGSYVELKDKESAPSKVKIMSKAEIARRFSKVLAVSPKKALTFMIFFRPNSKELLKESKKVLIDAIEAIKERSPCMVDIIGHTDTVGSRELNIKISLKRAKVVKSILKAKGVKVVSLVAKGYGEEDLQVQTADNVPEVKNRNVEIFIK